MDWDERFWADVARAIERQRIGEELVSIANRLGIGTLKTIGEKIVEGTDTYYIDFNSLVGAFEHSIWEVEDKIDIEDQDELYNLLERAEMAKGA